VRSAEFERCCFAVFNRIQTGDDLTMPLIRSVIADMGSSASAPAVYRQVSYWVSSVQAMQRLGAKP
jgi:hypothetical protein